MHLALLLHICYFGIGDPFNGWVGYMPLDYDDLKGSRDTMAEDDDFTFTDERTISPWGFNSASGRVTFTGNILETSHVADRKKDFRMILVVDSVPTLCIIRLEID
jgi:hypothetical protein